MKRIATLIFALGTLALLTGSAWGYEYLDNTWVQAYEGKSASTDSAWAGWFKAIESPSPSYFDIYGANFNEAAKVLSIFTNMPSQGDTEFGLSVGDLFFRTTGASDWNYAIKMVPGAGQAKIYQLTGYSTSINELKNSSLFYGGAWLNYTGAGKPPAGTAAMGAVPVKIAGGNILGATTVTWTQIGSNPTYEIDIALTPALLADLGHNFSFMWESATCGNGVIEAQVHAPLPGSLLLLGSGLLGMWFFSCRRKFAKAA
jgi:PEP-CTERM motif